VTAAEADLPERELAKFRMDDIYQKPAIRKLFEDIPDDG